MGLSLYIQVRRAESNYATHNSPGGTIGLFLGPDLIYCSGLKTLQLKILGPVQDSGNLDYQVRSV